MANCSYFTLVIGVINPVTQLVGGPPCRRVISCIQEISNGLSHLNGSRKKPEYLTARPQLRGPLGFGLIQSFMDWCCFHVIFLYITHILHGTDTYLPTFTIQFLMAVVTSVLPRLFPQGWDRRLHCFVASQVAGIQ